MIETTRLVTQAEIDQRVVDEQRHNELERLERATARQQKLDAKERSKATHDQRIAMWARHRVESAELKARHARELAEL